MYLPTLTVAAVITLLATPAGGFGVGFGAPMEERVGGDYGPEYYRNLQAPRHRLDDGRGSTRCRSRLTETRFGLRRVRRCY
jgi:hypothetical protein